MCYTVPEITGPPTRYPFSPGKTTQECNTFAHS
jgi:hypothetical protein